MLGGRRMKKVLILAYDFPPYTSMGGQRPYGWFKNLKEFGIEPTVITRHWPNEIKSKIDYSKACGVSNETITNEYGTLIKVPYKENLRDKILINNGFSKYSNIRKTLSLFYSIFQHLSFKFDNKSTIFYAANSLLAENKIDCIIATGEPFILFRYAHKLSLLYKIPWFADYRDCWSDNFEINRLAGFDKILHKTLFKLLEKHYVSSAKAITTAAPFFKVQLQQLFPNKNIEVIFNGFQERITSAYNEVIKQNKFEIAFAGTIYPFQPIELFLAGLKLFVNKNNETKINVVFYGTDFNQSQKDRITNFDKSLISYLTTTERIAQNSLYDKLKECSLLLLLDNKGMISGKLYEYLTMNKKILMAGGDSGSMEQILKETNTGIICNSPEEILQALQEAYVEWQQTGQVKCESKNIKQYSRKEQTKKLAELLKSL